MSIRKYRETELSKRRDPVLLVALKVTDALKRVEIGGREDVENIHEAMRVLHVEENSPEAILKVLKEGLRTVDQ